MEIKEIKKELLKIMSEASLGECNDKNNGIVDRCIVLLDILEGENEGKLGKAVRA